MTEVAALGEIFTLANGVDHKALTYLLRKESSNVREQRFIVAGAHVIPAKPTQPLSKAEDIFELAKESRPEFIRLAKSANGKISGKLVVPDDKSLARIGQKAEDDYNGDTSRVLDPLRCTINIKDINQYHKAVRFFSPDINSAIVRCENSFARPDDDGGLRRMMVNYRLSSGLVVEIQVRHVGMEKAYEETASLYKKIRAIRADVRRLEENGGNRDNQTLIATQHRLDTMISQRVRIHGEAAMACGMDKAVLEREFMVVNGIPVVKNFDPSTGEFETLIPDSKTGRFVRDNRFLHLQESPEIKIDRTISRDAFIARCVAIVQPQTQILEPVPPHA